MLFLYVSDGDAPSPGKAWAGQDLKIPDPVRKTGIILKEQKDYEE